MGKVLEIARPFGTPLELNWPGVLVPLTLSITAHGYAFRNAFPEWDSTERLLAVLVASGLLVLSMLLHELAHGIVAARSGFTVRSVTLGWFGAQVAISRMGDRPQPYVLFAFAAAGPAVNLVLAAVFLAIGLLLNPAVAGSVQIFAVCLAVAFTNVVLAISNLLPISPLDGGRIVHSVALAWHGRQR